MIGFIIHLQLKIQESKQLHQIKIRALRLTKIELLERQKNLYHKNKLIDNFNDDFNKAKEKIAAEIFLLQYDLFDNYLG